MTSNIISPGAIANTEGVERLSKNEDSERAVKRNPMGRVGTTKDISDATVYLFSDAGNHVNGTVLVGEWALNSAVLRGVLGNNADLCMSSGRRWVAYYGGEPGFWIRVSGLFAFG